MALARALVHQPGLLLLDEPLGALDALTRGEMQRLLERIWRRAGFSAVLVTHDVAEAVAMSDRVVVLRGGRATLDLRVDLPRPARPRQRRSGCIGGNDSRRIAGLTDAVAAPTRDDNARPGQERAMNVDIERPRFPRCFPPGGRKLPVAVIGSGFSGTMVALHLAATLPPDQPILLFERASFAKGAAYATSNACHLLNVCAANMSALPRQPDHFQTWLDAERAGCPDEVVQTGPDNSPPAGCTGGVSSRC